METRLNEQTAESPDRWATLKAGWFWCCMFCLACWGPYVLVSKLGAV